MSSESNRDTTSDNGVSGLNAAPWCLDKLAFFYVGAAIYQNSMYCNTKPEIFPWIKLEFPEEV